MTFSFIWLSKVTCDLILISFFKHSQCYVSFNKLWKHIITIYLLLQLITIHHQLKFSSLSAEMSCHASVLTQGTPYPLLERKSAIVFGNQNQMKHHPWHTFFSLFSFITSPSYCHLTLIPCTLLFSFFLHQMWIIAIQLQIIIIMHPSINSCIHTIPYFTPALSYHTVTIHFRLPSYL